MDLVRVADARARLELQGETPLADPLLLSAIVTHLKLAMAPRTPELLAEHCGCALRKIALPADVEGLLSPDGTIYVAAGLNRERAAVGILHEVAHWILAQLGVSHTHADVWLLTSHLAALADPGPARMSTSFG